jgi:hypothetical protein
LNSIGVLLTPDCSTRGRLCHAGPVIRRRTIKTKGYRVRVFPGAFAECLDLGAGHPPDSDHPGDSIVVGPAREPGIELRIVYRPVRRLDNGMENPALGRVPYGGDHIVAIAANRRFGSKAIAEASPIRLGL